MLQVFSKTCDILSLLLNDLLMLELKKFFLLLEIVYNLLEGLLQDKDLFFEDFDFLLLEHASSLILILCLSLNENISLLVLRITIKLSFLSFVVVKSVSLTHGLLCELLVLIVDIPFDLLDISLSILLCLLFELLKRCFILKLFLLLHSGKLDLNEILLFLEGLFKTCTILLPGHELQLILKLFLAHILHFLKVLIQLTHLDIGIFDLFLGLSIDFLYLFVIGVNCVIGLFFILLLQSLNFVLELNQAFRGFCVVSGETQDNILSVLDLLLVSILQIVHLSMPKQIEYTNVTYNNPICSSFSEIIL